MDDGGFQLIEILFFAVFAGFLVLRLRRVLGRRTGLEQRRDLFPPAKPTVAPPAPVPPRAVNGNANPPPVAADATGLAAVKAADPGFNDAAFLAGAQGAFKIIVNAFAAGDAAALQPLLSKDVFDRFAEAITARRTAHETLQSTVNAIKTAELVTGSINHGTALITVKFVSDQTNVTRAADGKVVEGEPDRVVEHVDFWTFARALNARDPNWTLVATESP
jgi:predicted lipid-binding transport protein (Tim44 family)